VISPSNYPILKNPSSNPHYHSPLFFPNDEIIVNWTTPKEISGFFRSGLYSEKFCRITDKI
jgi:hypothetical protein